LNTASVSCSPVGFPNVLEASDDHSVNLFQPSISVTKEGDPYSKVGDTVTYYVTIENTSSPDTPTLLLAAFSDSLVPGVVPPAECGALASAASCTFSYTYVVQAVDDTGEKGALMWNTAEAHYNPTGFPNDISDSSSWSVTLLHPSFTVSKECITPLVAPETNAEYEVVFTNTGDVDLIVTADEDLYDAVAMATIPAGTAFDLLEGESKTFTAYETAGYEPTVENIINASATLPEWTGLDNVLTGQDRDTCDVAGRIIITKRTTLPADKLFEFQASYYPDPFYLSDGESDDTDWTMAAGSYSVKEIEPLEWELEMLVCTDPSGDTVADLENKTAWIELAGGETVECTFTNDQLYLGYTPGFWKNHGPDAPSGHDAWQYTTYSTVDLMCPLPTEGEPVFVEACAHFPEIFEGLTMWQALYLQGGDGPEGAAEILARHAVATLLNADINEVQAPYISEFGDYPYLKETVDDVPGVIDLANAAFASEDRTAMLMLAAEFDLVNNAASDYFDWTGWPLVPQ